MQVSIVVKNDVKRGTPIDLNPQDYCNQTTPSTVSPIKSNTSKGSTVCHPEPQKIAWIWLDFNP